MFGYIWISFDILDIFLYLFIFGYLLISFDILFHYYLLSFKAYKYQGL